MSVRDFIQAVEAAQQRFLPWPAPSAGVDKPGADMRRDLSLELQRMEALGISQGEEPRSARDASWNRARVLHGLGYCVDFAWLHEPACAAPRHS